MGCNVRLGGHKSISPSRAWRCRGFVNIPSSPEPRVGGGANLSRRGAEVRLLGYKWQISGGDNEAEVVALSAL